MAVLIPYETLVDTTQDHAFGYKSNNYKVKNNSKFDPTKISFQWKKDKPDNRDYIYKPTANKTGEIVDLRQYCTAIEDQGNLGSCTGQAIVGAIELLNKRVGKTNDLSRLFVYYYERLIEGTVNYDSGAYIRDGIKACYTYGAPLESLWPYVIKRFATKPSNTAIKDAARRRITLYERAVNFNSCIDAINNGYPVIVGFLVYSSFMSSIVQSTGMMPYPNLKREILLGGHAVLLVGYDNSTQRFIARNSWGPNWGDKGYFYMPYQVIQNNAISSDFWVIKTVNSPR